MNRAGTLAGCHIDNRDPHWISLLKVTHDLKMLIFELIRNIRSNIYDILKKIEGKLICIG